MLIEVSSKSFKSFGEIRPPIRFQYGLNTILGGQKGDNSIGKSSFLQIIDFVFGGNSYLSSDAVYEVGKHSIEFTFEFSEKAYHFSRDTVKKESVYLCDSNYEPIKEWPLKKFTSFLFQGYHLDVVSGTFRDIISLYFRMEGKHNYNGLKPLALFTQEKTSEGITRLEKLFNVYEEIKVYEEARNKAEEKKIAFKKVRDFQLIPSTTTTQTQQKENLKKIENLKLELQNITFDTDENISNIKIEHLNQISQLQAHNNTLHRKLRTFKSQLAVVNINVNSSSVVGKNDLEELIHFFPNSNLKHLKEIQSFHHNIVTILDEELSQEAQHLQELIETTESEISKTEILIHEFGVPVNLSKKFLNKIGEITSQIHTLELLNENYELYSTLQKEYFATRDHLKEVQKVHLQSIENEINQKLVQFNKYLPGNKLAPVIKLKSDSSYEYTTPKDKGTGTKWKALILFDLAMLQLTQLPAIAHDSLLVKNIEAPIVDAIVKLYFQSQKQVFFAVDEIEKYSNETQKIVKKTAVINLNSGDNELFGFQWGKKK
jgi:hypothetical protein